MRWSTQPRSQGLWGREEERCWERGCRASPPLLPPMTMCPLTGGVRWR